MSIKYVPSRSMVPDSLTDTEATYVRQGSNEEYNITLRPGGIVEVDEISWDDAEQEWVTVREIRGDLALTIAVECGVLVLK
jgi:hypothetical protein